MPHIHTAPGQHDQTVSLYLFRTDFPEPKVMLHFHRKMNSVAQFGGHVELHETPWQTAAHELEEETGYMLPKMQLLQPPLTRPPVKGAVLHPYPAMHVTMAVPGRGEHFHTDTTYVFVTSQPPQKAPGEGESTDIRLYTEEELAAAKSEVESVTYDVAQHIFGEILPHWRAVPATDFKL